MHDAYDRLAAVVQCDQRTPVQLTEDEASRAVDRIDHPCQRRRARRAAMLFAENAVRRISPQDFGSNDGFRAAIRLRHRVVILFSAFVLDGDRPPEVRQDRRARRECDSAREFEIFRGFGGRHHWNRRIAF
jgi:hypothetical protein